MRNTSDRNPFQPQTFLHIITRLPTSHLYMSVKASQAALDVAVPPNLQLPLTATIDVAVVSFNRRRLAVQYHQSHGLLQVQIPPTRQAPRS